MKPMLISNRGSDKAQHRNSHGLEKPLNFAPFGHAELSLLAKI